MDPVLISNQVYQAIQLDTLEEPKAKSTILYANKYSGLGEIPISDSELLSVLNSTAGNAGNNVLVQLKQKMSAFRNGPWYIDSKDGTIYIHNRKYTSESVYNYTYNAENGELLMASFRMVEVNRGIEGLGGFVNAITKAVGMLNQKIESVELGAPPSKPFQNHPAKMGEDPMKGTFGQDFAEVHLNIPRRSQGDIINQNYQSKLAQDRLESSKKKKEFNAKSPQERYQAKVKAHEENYIKTDKNDAHRALQGRNPLYKLAYEYYLDCVKYYGNDSKEAKAAKSDMEREASKVNVPIKSYDADWGYYSVQLTTEKVGANIMYGITESQKQKALDKAIKSYVSKYGKRLKMSDYKAVNVRWMKLDERMQTYMQGMHYDVWYQATFNLNFWGYSQRRDSVRGDRLLKDLNPRYPNKGSNPASLISNAAANMGRRKKEKRLQATIRTIGNPILEVGMQIELQNVGQRQSGLWYIHQITHTLEHGQGYLCDAILSRQEPKAGAKGTSSEIHTQAYTTDSETASPSNGKVRKSTVTSRKSSKKYTKSNVTKGNSEYTYQDALNEPLTVEEVTYIRARAKTALSENEKQKIIIEELYNIADVKYLNKTKGTNYRYVKATNKKTGDVQLDKNKEVPLLTKDVKRTAGTSRHFTYLVKTTNIRKKK